MSKKAASIYYFDSSVLLRYSIRQVHAITNIEKYANGASSSVISKVECMRVLDRWRITREISDAKLSEARSRCLKLLGGLRLVELDAATLDLASQTFPIALKTLDALHLATALRLKQQLRTEISILTHDQKLALASEALGLQVVGA
jgi:uncharacterized protein